MMPYTVLLHPEGDSIVLCASSMLEAFLVAAALGWRPIAIAPVPDPRDRVLVTTRGEEAPCAW